MTEVPELIDTTESGYCSHELCTCPVEEPATGGEAYCSDYCKNADAGGIESEACACGHPECDVP